MCTTLNAADMQRLGGTEQKKRKARRKGEKNKTEKVRKSLVSWCFKPSQPQRMISGLRETFVKSYIVERTKKVEIRPEEQSQKTESCRDNLWNEIIDPI